MSDERHLAHRLHAAAIRVLRRVRGEDIKSGLTAARLSALSVLVFGAPCTISELAAAEQVALPTMTRLVQGLERDGLVRRQRGRRDARVVRVSATAAGRRRLEAARERRVRQLTLLLAPLGSAELARLADGVGVLEQVLAATPERGSQPRRGAGHRRRE